jgi:hypothetical protein
MIGGHWDASIKHRKENKMVVCEKCGGVEFLFGRSSLDYAAFALMSLMGTISEKMTEFWRGL